MLPPHSSRNSWTLISATDKGLLERRSKQTDKTDSVSNIPNPSSDNGKKYLLLITSNQVYLNECPRLTFATEVSTILK